MKIYNLGLTATIGSNAGTATTEKPALPRIDIKGDNQRGIITVNTGFNPGGEFIARINFTESYATDGAAVVVTPANRQAIGLQCCAEAVEGSGFEFNCTQQLGSDSVYQWYYEVYEILDPEVIDSSIGLPILEVGKVYFDTASNQHFKFGRPGDRG